MVEAKTEKDLNKIISDMRKKYGTEAVNIGKDYHGSNVVRWPITSPLISWVLGGGLPKGRIIEVMGNESAGKTSLACYLAGEVQKQGGTAAYIDVENAADLTYARTLGLNPDEVLFSQPESGEQALDIVYDLAVSKMVDVIIIDSVAALTPQAELDGEMGDQQMGLQARLVGKGMRKLSNVCGKNEVTLLFINQIREKIGQGIYGNPECVAPDTQVHIMIKSIIMKLTVSEMFKKAGIDWQSLEVGDIVDISDKDINVKSYNENTGEVEYRQVLSLLRKQDSPYYSIIDESGTELFKASPAHKIATMYNDSIIYSRLEDLPLEFTAINEDGAIVPLRKIEGVDKTPILDFEVEENQNYFANGILSHNTTPGGRALKFYASIRVEVRRVELIQKSQTDPPTGIITRVKSIKNKTAPPLRKGEVQIVFGQGFQYHKEYVDFGVEYDVIKKAASWYSLIDESGNEIEKMQGAEKVVEYCKEHDEYFQYLMNRVNVIMSPIEIEDSKEPEEKPKSRRTKTKSTEEELEINVEE